MSLLGERPLQLPATECRKAEGPFRREFEPTARSNAWSLGSSDPPRSPGWLWGWRAVVVGATGGLADGLGSFLLWLRAAGYGGVPTVA